MKKEISNEKALCSAIVLQAVKDYREATVKIEKMTKDLHKETDPEKRSEIELSIFIFRKRILHDLVPFFESAWCNLLSPIDGGAILKALEDGRIEEVGGLYNEVGK